VLEIRNEIPSDQELADYLDESLNSSSISLLTDYRSPQARLHTELVEALDYLSSRPISSEFLSDLKNALFLSLQRLNQLPRTNPFWRNSNLRPTIFKVGEFCEGVLSREPADVPSLLAISAMTIFHTSEFRWGRWTQLLALNAVSLEWIVFAAMYMEVCGADDSGEFAEFVGSSGMRTAITPLLAKIGEDSGSLLSRWSYNVLSLLAPH
jgi:hypothetical protein